MFFLLNSYGYYSHFLEFLYGNFYYTTPMLSKSFPQIAPVTKIVEPTIKNIVDTKKVENLPKIQSHVDLLIETAYLDPTISLEEAIKNAEVMINEFVSKWISDKFGLPQGIIQFSLPALFGDDFLKL